MSLHNIVLCNGPPILCTYTHHKILRHNDEKITLNNNMYGSITTLKNARLPKITIEKTHTNY